jgi:hypothetical protein
MGKIESSIQLVLAESQPDRDRVEALAREGRSLSELLVNNVNAMGASGLEHIVGGFLVTVARLETPDLQTLEEYGGQTLDYVIRLNWKDLLKLQNAAVDGPHVLKSPAPGSDLYELSTASVECFAGWCSLLDTMNCHYETRFPMSPSGS